MISSTIKFSQLEDRLDAEYYKPGYLELEKVLENSHCLSDVVEISKNKIDPTENPNQEFCYLEIDNVNLFTGQVEKQKLLGRNAPSRARKKVKLNDCIISTVRPNRNAVGFIDNELENCICSTGFAVLRSKEILSGYLFALLKSKIVINQLVRLTSAAMYPAVSEEEIANIKIPIPSQSFQKEIEKMIKESQRKRKLADEKYKEAEEILNEKLGLNDLDLSVQNTPKNKLCFPTGQAFETKFSEMEDRFDPEYYKPVFKKIEKLLKKQKVISLGNISSEIKYGTSEDLFYTEKGTPFLRVTDINKFSNIESKEGKFISNFDAERLKEYQVKKDDIIISRTGTLGFAVYINEKLDGAIYGSYFIKVKPQHKDLSNKFIAFFISSKIGKLQTSRWASGGIQTNLTIDAIKSIQIPILPKPTQQKISLLIQESMKLRREAKELIDRAKREVEAMVE